jgi:hypothetical protein
VEQRYRLARSTLVASVQQLLGPSRGLPPALVVGRPFDSNLGLDCRGLAENFRENLAFEFSWSWEKIAPKYLPPAAQHSIEMVAADLKQRVGVALDDLAKRGGTSAAASSSAGAGTAVAAAASPAETTGVASALVRRVGYATMDIGRACWEITTQTPYGFVLAACVPSAWRLLRFKSVRYTVAGLGVVISLQYAYERLRYTTAAQVWEPQTKSQVGKGDGHADFGGGGDAGRRRPNSRRSFATTR